MAKSSSAPRVRKNSKPWSSAYSCGGEGAHTASLIILPLLLAVLFLCAGADTLIVFEYTAGGAHYEIAAEGYSTTGHDGVDKPQLAYPAPTSWRSPVTGIPLLLLFHLIVGILLVIYVAALIGFSYYFRKKSDEGIGRPGRSSGGFCVTTLHLFFWLASSGLVIFDLAMIVLSNTRGRELIPGFFGYFLIILGSFLCTTWLVVLFYRPPEELQHGGDKYKIGGGCFAGCCCDRA